MFVILGATFIREPRCRPAPTIRAIALAPEQFENRSVTLTGRFRGRNLYGDLPQGVAKSKWDFVLQSADAAIWVTGLRPKGKDFDLDASARGSTPAGGWKSRAPSSATVTSHLARRGIGPPHDRSHRRADRGRRTAVCRRSRRRL